MKSVKEQIQVFNRTNKEFVLLKDWVKNGRVLLEKGDILLKENIDSFHFLCQKKSWIGDDRTLQPRNEWLKEKQTKVNNMIFIGMDISLSHSGIVITDNDKNIIDWTFISKEKKWFTSVVNQKHGIHIKPIDKKNETKEHYLEIIKESYLNILNNIYIKYRNHFDDNTVYCCIEDYAFNALSKSLTQIAELTGIIKHELYSFNAKMRYVAPKTLKKWIKHGNATKQEIFDITINDFEIPKNLIEPDKQKNDIKGPGTDIADAYWLSNLIYHEYLLKEGDLVNTELPPNKREVLISILTNLDKNTNNLLRPFVYNDRE